MPGCCRAVRPVIACWIAVRQLSLPALLLPEPCTLWLDCITCVTQPGACLTEQRIPGGRQGTSGPAGEEILPPCWGRSQFLPSSTSPCPRSAYPPSPRKRQELLLYSVRRGVLAPGRRAQVQFNRAGRAPWCHAWTHISLHWALQHVLEARRLPCLSPHSLAQAALSSDSATP